MQTASAIERDQTYLTTDELSVRIKYDVRTIRERLKDSVLLEGVHYFRPFADARSCISGRPSSVTCRPWCQFGPNAMVGIPMATGACSMPSIRVHKPNGALFFDFRYNDERCREYTLLPDTPANRKKLEKVLDKIESEIASGTFVYENYFPTARHSSAWPRLCRMLQHKQLRQLHWMLCSTRSRLQQPRLAQSSKTSPTLSSKNAALNGVAAISSPCSRP